MSQKKLNENAIVNELKGSSLFFQRNEESPTFTGRSKGRARSRAESLENPHVEKGDSPTSSLPSTIEPNAVVGDLKEKLSGQDGNNASTLASYRASLINSIRKTVKSVGKEVSFVRLTPEEKNQLIDIVYTYKRQGVKTSENEINRIAVNFLLEDYKANGKSSVLARVIDALLA